MSAAVTHANDHDHEDDHEHHDSRGTTLIGFWIYLMSDCILFAGLFATYAVLSRSYAGGPTGWELFDLNFVAVETAHLPSSLTPMPVKLRLLKKFCYSDRPFRPPVQ